MLRRNLTMGGLRLAGLLFLATPVAAAEDAEFAFNLFSDIAPILALFGEQFARQFTSESMTWLDHLIFAMVPLGILTVITGAIRVQGPRIARSFIGRARENRALTEIELMSSTSGEVCELFNGKSIVRAMGKPRIEQFLIFPKVYDELEAKYKEADKRDDKTSKAAKPPADRSCGIHTLKSAVSTEKGLRRERLMECAPYHSYSYELVHGLFQRLKELLFRTKSIEKATGDEEASPSIGDSTIGKSYDWVGPPNLQLNLSSDHFEKAWMRKRHELFLAAVVAVVLQAGLIATAAVTVFHRATRHAINSEAKVYGFPCYFAGSVLLSLGMGLCSLSIEQSTVEHAWKVLRPGKEKGGKKSRAASKSQPRTELQDYPRLVWLQQNQTVNDQAFDAYTILGGPKRYIVTSSRIEDTEKWQKKREHDRRHHSVDLASESGSVDSHTDLDASEISASSTIWKFLTVVGAGVSAIGFIAQFMGLRGLAYPCSIAQLVAIVLMALIRALIRRRLGRIPAHCSALPRYELDFLATHITFCPEFRNFYEVKGDEYKYLRQAPDLIWQWRVDTAKPRDESPFLFRCPKEIVSSGLRNPEDQPNPDLSEMDTDEVKTTKDSLTPVRRHRFGHNRHFKMATSQQLLRVRERLGDLCGWTSKASESALALVQSIELFMNTFFPSLEKKQLDWVVETIMPPSASSQEERNLMTISIRRLGEKWEVDIGTVDAALSLWMAYIEAKTMQEKEGSTKGNLTSGPKRDSQKTPDWRRAKAGTGMKYSFCRILGDDFEDGVLKRDLSWWVDELVADTAANQTDGSADESADGSAPTTKWRQSRARKGDVDLVIGFNGRPENVDPRRKTGKGEARELALVSSASLSIILAQHLFTSFMWTVVEELPRDSLHQGFNSIQQDVEVDGRNKFDPYEFIQTWHWPTLRHRQLTKVVRQMEVYGLGSTIDILLCIIPALSFKDLLPNHAMLKLIPQVGHGQGWAETARCYSRLLETSIGTATEEKFCYAVVIAVMDFLYFACEPYDEYITPPRELEDELMTIVAKLVSDKFVHVVRKLAPVYDLQHRRKAFAYIFNQFKSDEDTDGYLNVFETQNIDIDEEFAMQTLGFSKHHQQVHSAMKAEQEKKFFLKKFEMEGKEAVTPDIFGWTPLHYACFAPPDGALSYMLDAVKDMSDLPVHKIFDAFRRSPVHIAASSGKRKALEMMLEPLNNEDQKNAVNMGGLDGMTPLHLATRIGSTECVDYIIKTVKMRVVTEVDVWGREAFHIAASGGDANIAMSLLKAGSRPDAMDKIGKSPIDYLLKGDQDLKNDQDPESDQEPKQDQASGGDETETDQHPEDEEKAKKREEDKVRAENKRRIFVELARKKPGYQDEDGRTFLHRAAELTDYDTISKLLQEEHPIDAQDLKGRTPLHYAILAGRTKIALSLIDGINGQKSEPSVKDKMSTTTLMFSTQRSLVDVINRVLQINTDASKDTDDNGWTALHHAVETTDCNLVRFLVEKGCDPTTKNSDGRTALHMALANRQKDMAKYLLEEARIQDDPNDNEGVSLLVSACRSDDAGAIQAILQKWPGIINDPDPEYEQTALCWACERGNEEAVRALLKFEELDLNKPATKWRDYTSLHFAVSAEEEDILRWLVERDSVDLDARNRSNETALQMAVDRQQPECAMILLLHKSTPDKDRIKHLKQFSSSSDQAFQDMIPKILAGIEDESLSDDDLVELVEASTRRGMVEVSETYFEIVSKRNVWEKFKLPYHLAARAGSLKIIKLLTEQGANPAELDEDNWSCVDHAARYGHQEIVQELSDFMRQHSKQTSTEPPRHAVPTSLEVEAFKDSIASGPCVTSGHKGCKVVDIRVQAALELGKRKACLRSKNCIPPPTPSTKHFYFEVTVLEDSKSRSLGIGFCDDRAQTEAMPGWFDGSWGYHGDDGNLFLESGWGFAPNADFGPAAEYAAGDIAGVGMNLETGEGFCTLNGKRKDTGTSFESRKFNFGKLYPCLGVDVTEEGVGLHFVVNFGGSDGHPFKYMGPFV